MVFLKLAVLKILQPSANMECKVRPIFQKLPLLLGNTGKQNFHFFFWIAYECKFGLCLNEQGTSTRQYVCDFFSSSPCTDVYDILLEVYSQCTCKNKWS